MHSINVHIEESVAQQEIEALRHELLTSPHVCHVEMAASHPHEMLVEFEAHHNIPMSVLGMLQQHGLHGDIVGC